MVDVDPIQPWPSFTKTYHHDVYPAIDPTQPALDCSSRTVLITGAGAGVGKGIALCFAKAHAKGIALIGRTESTLKETASEIKRVSGGKTAAIVLVADITDQQQVQSAMGAAAKQFDNRIDVLVNNAGGIKAIGPIADIDLKGFWDTYTLNVLGPMVVTQAFCKLVRTSSAPDAPRTVINIPSGAAQLPYNPTAVAYSSSKLAISKVIEFLHYENPTWRVFNMQPGVVATEMARSTGREAPDSPNLPGSFAVWLAAHPDAEKLNGCFLWANWDISEVLERADEIKKRDLLKFTLKGWAEDVSVDHLKAVAEVLHENAKKKNR